MSYGWEINNSSGVPVIIMDDTIPMVIDTVFVSNRLSGSKVIVGINNTNYVAIPYNISTTVLGYPPACTISENTLSWGVSSCDSLIMVLSR